jgi:putative DNA primase/helicase
LADKLRSELPGILAWCVRGCLDWQQKGLASVEEVEQATVNYRSFQDVLGTFLRECCNQGPQYSATAKNLYTVFQCWCDESGEKRPANQREFGRALTERGLERYTDNGTKYRGLGLRAEWLEKVEPCHRTDWS